YRCNKADWREEIAQGATHKKKRATVRNPARFTTEKKEETARSFRSFANIRSVRVSSVSRARLRASCSYIRCRVACPCTIVTLSEGQVVAPLSKNAPLPLRNAIRILAISTLGLAIFPLRSRHAIHELQGPGRRQDFHCRWQATSARSPHCAVHRG